MAPNPSTFTPSPPFDPSSIQPAEIPSPNPPLQNLQFYEPSNTQLPRSFHKSTKVSLSNPPQLCDFLSLEAMQEPATSSLLSSSERSSSSAPQMDIKEGNESDEEIRRVPEFGGELGGASTSGRESGSLAGPDPTQSAQASQRKRGRTPAEKEHKRLKRLLRNRVSAQQARERKKAYLNDLEVKVKDLERRNSELEERVSTLQNENQMLRHVLKNTTVNRRGSE